MIIALPCILSFSPPSPRTIQISSRSVNVRHAGSRRYGKSGTNHDDDVGIAPVKRNDAIMMDKQRRNVWKKTFIQGLSLLSAGTVLAVWTRRALAFSSASSRTDGYEIQKTEDEWKQQLSQIQYNILREGGTERPGYSVLESETRPGVFNCAGCGTALFETKYKFKSGTGWPSFARSLNGVEIENVDPITSSISGAELRCKTCGGHLGDVFSDGFLFIGTEAAKSGKRFCIDGAALVFYPEGDENNPVRGDIPAKSKKVEWNWLDPPTITPRSKE